MAPPKMPALLASLVPAFLPITMPAKHITKVTAPISRQASSASAKLYSAMVKPTDSASMDVATPCTSSAPKPTAGFSPPPSRFLRHS